LRDPAITKINIVCNIWDNIAHLAWATNICAIIFVTISLAYLKAELRELS